MNESKILVVIEDILESVKINNWLDSLGYQFNIVYPYLKETFNSLKNFKPDLILMDVFLRGNGDKLVFDEINGYDKVPILYFAPKFKEETLQRVKLNRSDFMVNVPHSLDLDFVIERTLYNHQTNQVLEENENRFQLLIENADDAIAVINYSGRLLALNDCAAGYFGEKHPDLHGKTLWDIFSPEYANYTLKVIREVINSGEGCKMDEELIIQDEKRWFNVNIQPIESFSGYASNVQLIARDITPYKEKEQALKEEQNFFQATLNDMNTFVAVLRPTGEIIFVNNTPLKLIGKKLRDLKGKMFYEVDWWTYSAEIAQKIKNDVEQCALGKNIDHEIQINSNNGLIWIDYSMHPIYDDMGEVKYLVPEGRDISGKKEFERALESEKSRLKMLHDNSPFGMVFIDKNGAYKYINPKFSELFGYQLNEIPSGKEWFKKAFPDPKKRSEVISTWVNDFKDAKVGDNKPRTFEVTCKDGERKIIHFVPVLLENREYLMTVRDITRQTMAERAIKESEERFRTVAQSALDAIIITNIDGTIIYSNESMQRIFGYLEDEISHKSLNILLAGRCREDFQRNLQRFKFSPSGAHSGMVFELHGLRKDGSEFPLEISLTIWEVGGEEYITHILRDITERKLVDYELEKIHQRFQQMANHIEEVFWIMDHHLSQIIYISPSYRKLWGRSRESLFDNPHSWIESIFPEDRREVVETIFRSPPEIRAGAMTEVKYRIVRPDGTIRWIRTQIYPILNSENEVFRTVGISEDITPLQKAREKYLNLMESISSGVYRSNFESNRFTEINPALIKMSGYEKTELLALNYFDLYRNPEDRIKLNEELIKKGFFKNKEVQLKKKDGTLVDVRVREVAVKDGRGIIKYCDGVIEEI